MNKYAQREQGKNAKITFSEKSSVHKNDLTNSSVSVRRDSFNAVQFKKKNNTGLPDNLKVGIENLSGYSMDDVTVHYNSSKPATVQAYAFTQGSDIHLASGQEKHLAHEAWHVVQQKAGRVQPTVKINGMNVNDNAGLEHEADVMGKRATFTNKSKPVQLKKSSKCDTLQLMPKLDLDMNGDRPDAPNTFRWDTQKNGMTLERDHIIPYDTIRDYTLTISGIQNTAKNWSATTWVQGAFNTAKRDGRYEPDRNAANYQQRRAAVEQQCAFADNLLRNEAVPQHDVLDAETLITQAVAWMPGNIVMAPQHRSDDLHGGFDEPLLKIADKNIKYRETYDKMVEVIEALRGIDEDEQEGILKDSKISKNIKFINEQLQKIAKKTSPYQYDETMWQSGKIKMDENTNQPYKEYSVK